MKIQDNGREINATISTEKSKTTATIYVHARGGNGLNSDYAIGLRLVIERLRDLGCGWATVLLASKPAMLAIRSQRVLMHFDAAREDSDAIRKEIGRLGGRWGRPADSTGSGNNTKRVAIEITSDLSALEIETRIATGRSAAATVA